jgi:hypothetical protein
MKWKLMVRTVLYGTSLTAFAAAVHQVVLPRTTAHAEPACCNAEEPNNSCGINARCEYTNEQCQGNPENGSGNAQGYTCVAD